MQLRIHVGEFTLRFEIAFLQIGETRAYPSALDN